MATSLPVAKAAGARSAPVARTRADGGAPQMEQTAWLGRVMSRQQSQMTPEVRASIARRAEVSARAAKSAKRAERLQVCSAMTKQSWARGMRAQSNVAVAAPARAEATAAAQSEMLMLRHAMSNESEDDDEVGGQLMALQAVTQTETADTSEIESLLQQLIVEPTEDAERVAKFKLYEELMETVEAARKVTFNFYLDCADDLHANVQAAIKQNLKAIDGGDNMAVDFREDRWFVYDMTRKLNDNTSMLERVLQDIKTKLDLVARQEDCPICLDSMESLAPEEIKVLGCCHKVCGECWAQWQAIKQGRGFCPLCKHEEFLGDVCEGHAIPVDVFERARQQM